MSELSATVLPPDNLDNELASIDVALAPPSLPGVMLAAAREANGLSIEQVASQLNLAPRQVLALEQDNYAALPGMVIVRGFLRVYARLLKLDPVPLIAALGELNTPTTATPMRHALSASFSETRLPSLTSTGTRRNMGPVVIAVVLLTLAGASYGLGWWPEALLHKMSLLHLSDVAFAGKNSSGSTLVPVDAAFSAASNSGTQEVISSVIPLSSGVNKVISSSATAESGTMEGPVAEGVFKLPQPSTEPAALRSSGAVVALVSGVGNPLTFTVREESWIEIKRNDNSIVVARVFKAGEMETIDIHDPVTLVVGNVAGVKASLRGQPVDLLNGATGNVAHIRLK